MKNKESNLWFKKVLGVFLAVFLGNFGFHHALLGRYKLSFVYALFFWTGIPGLVALIEAFYMPKRIELSERENVKFNPYKFIGFPIMGFMGIFILGGGLKFFIGNLSYLSKFHEGKYLKNKKVDSLQQKIKVRDEDVSSGIIKNKKEQHEINKILSKLISSPNELYQSDYLSQKVKKTIPKKNIISLTELLKKSESIDRGLINRISGGLGNVGEKGVKVKKIYSFNWYIYQKDRSDKKLVLDFWVLNNGKIQLGRIEIEK